MFTRGRPCLRRRGLSAVLDNVVAGPEEPLLFLYPRWFTSAVRQQRSIASINTATATRRQPGPDRILPRGIRPSRRLSFGRSARRWISSNAAVTAGSNNIDVSARDGSSTGVQDDGPNSQLPAARSERSSSTVMTQDRTPSTDKKRPYNLFADIETTDVQPPSDIGNENTGYTHTRPLAVSPTARERLAIRRLSVRDRRKLRYRLFQSKRIPDNGAKRAWSQWNDIKKLLERFQQDARTWSKKGTKQKELLVPEETVALLAGITDMAMKENVWYVAVHNGCRVHVLHPLESEGRFRKVIISGSDRVVELVVDRIKKAQALQENGDPLVDIRKPAVTVFPSIDAMRRKNIPVPIIRGVWDFYQARERPARLDQLPSTSFTTVREFAEHIEDLTRSQPSVYRRNDKQPRVPHETQVAKRLVKLFKNEANYRLISTAALNRALTFLCEHEFLRSSRAVFLRAEHVTTVDTFNIFLRAAARRQDIRVFRRFLLSMHRAHVRPDPYTWLAFLDCLVSPKAKTNLVTHILQKGYLSQTSAIRTALQLTIQDTFYIHLKNGQSVDSFIETILDTGANWFPPSLLNQMFSVTARLKDFDSMDRLLEICNQQRLKINSSTLNQIILFFRADIFSALRYVFRCNRPGLRLERETWERLFLIAFKGRHFNICRVIWRYACMNGGVTDKMTKTVLTSLSRNVVRKKGTDFDNLWRISAGNVIVGVDFHLSHYPLPESILSNIPSEFRKNPHLFLTSGFKAEGGDRETQRRLASELVHRDIEVGSMYRPVESLAIMLDAAAVIDLEWKGIPRPVTWLMQNAIQVPVKRKLYTR
ncbi:hypothetical protein AWENTII_001117 [Aspergillus wentii]|nr:hypothetical protein MW887_001588 [Aspergillus wentii]